MRRTSKLIVLSGIFWLAAMPLASAQPYDNPVPEARKQVVPKARPLQILYPDLAVTSLRVTDDRPVIGARVEVRFEFKNIGNATAQPPLEGTGAAPAIASLELAAPGQELGDLLGREGGGSDPIVLRRYLAGEPLRSGQSRSFSEVLHFNAEHEEGTYSLCVVVDPGAEIAERNERNNRRCIALHLSRAAQAGSLDPPQKIVPPILEMSRKRLSPIRRKEQ